MKTMLEAEEVNRDPLDEDSPRMKTETRKYMNRRLQLQTHLLVHQQAQTTVRTPEKPLQELWDLYPHERNAIWYYAFVL